MDNEYTTALSGRADFIKQFQEIYAAGIPCVSVTLVDVVGSAPQDVGAKMVVAKDGIAAGTVGGGKVEKRCLDLALGMLSDTGSPATAFHEWNLQTDIGMTCGGVVRFFFETHHRGAWQIVLFGAGHTSQALVRVIAAWDCQITCIDQRSDWLGKLPASPRLRRIHAEDMPSCVASLPDNAFVLLLTMGHSTDSPILLEVLRNKRFPFVGVIGSRTKALRLKKDIRAAGLSASAEEAFVCPVGLDFGGNDPGEIAVSIAAQLLQVRDALHPESRRGRHPVSPDG